LIDRQRRYFVELRQQVRKGIREGKEIDDIIRSIAMPWYKEWTGVDPKNNGDNIKHVYAELTGQVTPPDLIRDFGIVEGPPPTYPADWKPRRIVVPNLMPARLAELKRIAPAIEFIPLKNPEDAVKVIEDADAALFEESFPNEIIAMGKKLRWIGLGHTGV